MRINVIASDAGGKTTACDIFITVVDVNEPPVIDHIDVDFGEKTNKPFVFDSTDVNIGDTVGMQIPAQDPDTVANDVARCRLAELDDAGDNTNDDRELFDITDSCQIIVKVVDDGTTNLQSGTDTGFYTLFIEAYDQGPSPILTSAKRMYHIQGKTGLISPVFDTGDIMFKQNENSGGIVDGQASTSTKNYSHWEIDIPQKLFVMCTDDNVYQRGTTIIPNLAGDRDPACSTYTSQSDCESLSTGCEYDAGIVGEYTGKSCVTRQQSLRYQVLFYPLLYFFFVKL